MCCTSNSQVVCSAIVGYIAFKFATGCVCMPALLKIVHLIILVVSLMQLSFVVTHLLVYDHTRYVPTVILKFCIIQKMATLLGLLG